MLPVAGLAAAKAKVKSEPAVRNTRLLASLYALALFALNAVIVRRLFVAEFTGHMNSNEGTFMAISRFLVENWPHVGWFPYWSNGLAFENTYTPGLQVLDAVFAALAHTSTAHAFHAVIAFFYCLGPAMLFLFVWQTVRRPHAAFLCGLVYSLFSPSVIFPAVRVDLGGWTYARRLQTLVHYGEGAHNVVLSLLPLALLTGYFAMTRRRYGWWVATGALMGLLVLTNAFAATDLAIGLFIMAMVQPSGERLRSLAYTAITGVIAYAWISPLLTPTLIQTMRADSVLDGDFRYTPQVLWTWLAVLAGGVLLWIWTRRFPNVFDRFAPLFAYIFFAIPALIHFANITLLPQPLRYHLEMEMGVAMAFTFLLRRVRLRSTGRMRMAGLAAAFVFLAVLLGFLVRQTKIYIRFAHGLIPRFDITSTIEYKTARWIQANLPGRRVMASGDVGTWLNVFTDNPQLTSGHDPFSPNWMIEIAGYAIYSGDNAGARDAQISITWLKAFGCHAITVPGPKSRETYKPFWHPRKFDGVLPELWHQEDDTIYAIPERSSSLAHVIPDSAVIRRVPVNGLDIEDVTRYVAALDNPALPDAPLAWTDPSHGRITASVRPGQVVAVQVTYDRGWTARTHGRNVPINRDAIGLMVLRPECNGACDIDLVFDGGIERKICLTISLLTMLAVLLFGARQWIVRVFRFM